jgi:uncharacterized membrane protein
MAAIVLMEQNRMSKIAVQGAHLELQINLMTERETTNVIRMLAKVGSRVGIQHNALDEEKLIKLLRSKFPSQ